MKIGYFLSTEEYPPAELVRQARQAEAAGFDALWISDHFHPWNDAQGQSPFVWAVIGALSQACSLPVTTAVTCPTVRIHPAVVAQAAATAAVLLQGRFTLGVGSGEALNEHITGAPWPSAEIRADMLEEAIAVMRSLWEGDFVNHRGTYYTVDQARIYTLPDEPPPVYVSGFGERSAALAGRIGDGYVTTSPDEYLLDVFRTHGGEGKPTQAGYKVCWSTDDDAAIDAAHRLWANSALPGEAAQVLPNPRHFEQLSTLVSRDMTRDSVAFGSDVQRHIAAFRPFARAGFDEVYISQMAGLDPRCSAEGFFTFYRDRVLPELRALAA